MDEEPARGRERFWDSVGDIDKGRDKLVLSRGGEGGIGPDEKWHHMGFR